VLWEDQQGKGTYFSEKSVRRDRMEWGSQCAKRVRREVILQGDLEKLKKGAKVTSSKANERWKGELLIVVGLSNTLER